MSERAWWMTVTRAVGRTLDALRRLSLWQRVLVVYAISVPLCWILWQLQVSDRRPASHALFSFVIGPIAIAIMIGLGTWIGRTFREPT